MLGGKKTQVHNFGIKILEKRPLESLRRRWG